MKKASLVLVFLSVFASLPAQTAGTSPKEVKNRNMAFDISAGYSFALGNYASADSLSKKSGYAAGGFLVQVAFDWIGKKDLGLALQYTYQQNPLQDIAGRIIPNGMKSPTMGKGSWSNHYLMAGPVFMKSIGRLYMDAKILGGVVVSSSTNFNTPDPFDTLGLRYSRNTGTGFGFQVSAGAGYTISPHLALKFNLNLLGGSPVGRKQYPSKLIGYEKIYDPGTGLSYDKPIYSAPIEYEIKKVITTLNPSIGLVYRF